MVDQNFPHVDDEATTLAREAILWTCWDNDTSDDTVMARSFTASTVLYQLMLLNMIIAWIKRKLEFGLHL